MSGYYTSDEFDNHFVTREEFHANKDKDGYIKYIWSFGNNGNDYLYGKDKEEIKHKIHDYIVFNKPCEEFKDITLESKTVHDRRLEFQKKAHARLQNLERLQSLIQLESLQGLESLQRLESLQMTCMDYRDYEYQEGDVVYCDIPYEDSLNKDKDYGGGFSWKDFYQWAKEQSYPVYYSSYTKGTLLWQKQVRTVMNSASGGTMRNEALFCI